MKKGDKLLIIVILLIIILGGIYQITINKLTDKSSLIVEITQDNKLIETYYLTEEIVSTIYIDNQKDHFNEITIHNGSVNVTSATCPDYLCVQHMRINNINQSIVCLPNKVLVTIKNEDNSISYDDDFIITGLK